MLILKKHTIITSLALAVCPLFLTGSAFTYKTVDKPAKIVASTDAKKYNLEVLKSPFAVIEQKKHDNKNEKHAKKSVKKAEKKHSETTQTVSNESTTTSQPVVEQTSYTPQQTQSTSTSGADSSAAQQIMMAESSGNPNAQNGRYVGLYQLDASYLHGDYSVANQKRVFVQYCNQRYGSVENALAFRQAHNWY